MYRVQQHLARKGKCHLTEATSGIYAHFIKGKAIMESHVKLLNTEEGPAQR